MGASSLSTRRSIAHEWSCRQSCLAARISKYYSHLIEAGGDSTRFDTKSVNFLPQLFQVESSTFQFKLFKWNAGGVKYTT